MRKRVAGLYDFVGTDTVIRIDRKPIDKHLLDGFLIGASEKLLLLHVVDGNTCMLNGYAIVRLSDVRSFRLDESFVSRALRLLGRVPVAPEGIDLSDWAGVFASVTQSRYPTLMIETEKKEPECCWIGSAVGLTKKHIDLKKINPDGEWAEIERFRFKDITKVKFDDGYVNALTHLVTEETVSQMFTAFR